MAMDQSKTEFCSHPERRVLDRLLQQIAAGDRQALAQLYEATRGAVYALALSYLGRAQEAEDVTQEAYVRIWDAAPGYVCKGSPMAWVLTIARNLALMQLRSRSRTVELDEEQWNAIPAHAPAVTLEDRQVLQQAMETITPQERQIVLLHAVGGLRHREIARMLDLPLSTVLSKYSRTLKKLKHEMEGDRK